VDPRGGVNVVKKGKSLSCRKSNPCRPAAEKKVLKKIFGHKEKERNLWLETIRQKDHSDGKIKENEMWRACRKHGGGRVRQIELLPSDTFFPSIHGRVAFHIHMSVSQSRI
jgi:hypothetical protein